MKKREITEKESQEITNDWLATNYGNNLSLAIGRVLVKKKIIKYEEIQKEFNKIRKKEFKEFSNLLKKKFTIKKERGKE